jgi:hypothetical protein
MIKNLNSSDELVPEIVQGILDRPRESLSIELKNWIDPSAAEGKAKIVKACLALRNQNGGFLVIGIDDSQLIPLAASAPDGVRQAFHCDVIQGLISKYSSHAFEVTVYFPSRDGCFFPVIQDPAGLINPASCRADLKLDGNGKYLLREGEIYVRTFASNGTVSSARAPWKDLDSLMNRCHDNREANLARVFGRMAQGMTRDSIAQILQTFAEIATVASDATAPRASSKLLDEGETRFKEVVRKRGLILPPHGCWDTSLVLEGQIPKHRPNQEFLQRLASANPDLTGWPVWLDSSPFFDQAARPYVTSNTWEAFMFEAPSEETRQTGHLDFWILDPVGRFFLRRALQDDIGGNKWRPLFVLEPQLAILRVAEALAVGQAFARALGCDEQTGKLSFSFRWSNLQDRRLEGWAFRQHIGFMGQIARDNEARSAVVLAQSANEESICLATHEAVLPLMAVFGGYEPSYESTRSLVTNLLQRKLLL